MFSRHALRSSSAAYNLSGGVTLYSLQGATVNTQTTYSIRIPDNITSIAAVAIGAGGAGGGCSSSSTASVGGAGGGALSYSNRISVTPGETLTVLVPNGSQQGGTSGGNGSGGLTASIARGATILLSADGGNGSTGRVGAASTPSGGASGGSASVGVGDVKYSGGAGGSGSTNDQGGGGGGAAGYAGNGGIGGTAGGAGNNAPSSSGGGGGGGTVNSTTEGGSGGGVLFYGKGDDGVGGTAGAAAPTRGGTLGSSLGGNNYVYNTPVVVRAAENLNALFGGGGGGAPSGGTTAYSGVRGSGGAVRIIWGPDVDWGTAKNTSLNRLSVRSSASSSSSTIAMPEVELGDTAIFIDYAENTSGAPTAVTPSGFTIRLNSTTGTRRLTTYYKRILSSAETGTSLTGANGTASNAKIIIVIRGRRGASYGDQGTDTTLGGAVGATSSTGGISFISGSASDPYATGIPVHFAFFNSTVDLSESSIILGNIPLETVTVSGSDAKTFVKVGFLPQEINGSYNTSALFTSATATNTYGFWESRFY